MPNGAYHRKPFTVEHRHRLSESRKRFFVEHGFINSNITKEKISDSIRKLWKDPEYKKRVTLAHKEKWKDPIYRAKQMKHRRTMIGDRSPAWRGGLSFQIYPLGWNKTFKEQIRYRDGYKCQLCGVPESECSRKLHVHHIDYNKQNIEEKNLISLCMCCHLKTNTKKINIRNSLRERFEKTLCQQM
jgi:5-methylcytosine-specific restriction endonuclease McrA